MTYSTTFYNGKHGALYSVIDVVSDKFILHLTLIFQLLFYYFLHASF